MMAAVMIVVNKNWRGIVMSNQPHVDVTTKRSLISRIVDRCDNCKSLKLSVMLDNNDNLCRHCYYEEAICECEECGREITAFDYNDFGGLCGYCHDKY